MRLPEREFPRNVGNVDAQRDAKMRMFIFHDKKVHDLSYSTGPDDHERSIRLQLHEIAMTSLMDNLGL